MYMAAVRGLPLNGTRGLITASSGDGRGKGEEGGAVGAAESKETAAAAASAATAAAATPSRKVKGLEAKLARLAAGEGGKEGENEEGDEDEDELPEGALAGALGPVMEGMLLGKKGEAVERGGQMEGEDEDENPDAEVHRRAKEEAAKATLFKGLKFFLAREVPLSWIHLVLASFGGLVGWEGEGSPFTEGEKGITHQVVDRPVPQEGRKEGREYVQPQWIFDSVNAKMRLPVDLYGPGKALPVRYFSRGWGGGGGGWRWREGRGGRSGGKGREGR